jgi:hypothetical protein
MPRYDPNRYNRGRFTTRAPVGGRPQKWIGRTGIKLLEDVELFRALYGHQTGEKPATAFILREFLKIGGVAEHSIGRKLKALEARYYEAKRHHGRFRVPGPGDDPIQRTTWAEWAEAVLAEQQWPEKCTSAYFLLAGSWVAARVGEGTAPRKPHH